MMGGMIQMTLCINKDNEVLEFTETRTQTGWIQKLSLTL